MPQDTPSAPQTDLYQLALDIKRWGHELGFQQTGITDTQLDAAEQGLQQWLSLGCHGDMDYMAKHGVKRTRPTELFPGTLRVISVRMNYSPPKVRDSWDVINDARSAFISRYALGRDYHKVMRHRLAALAKKIEQHIENFHFRVFTDSAPVMEVELAKKSGIGWRGKHTLLLTREAGSMFFLGEIYTDLPLPVDGEQGNHCGTCQSCIDVCPTQAIVAPYKLDARRCISYLTIEHRGSIPLEFRALIGNRVYGCDDCQLVCPWNKFAQATAEPDFAVRNGLDDVTLIELFGWNENEFEQKLAGSAIHRIGHERWLRNIAIGLGNAGKSPAIIAALRARAGHISPLVREHVQWALQKQLYA
ncbi:MAG: tRNA epoxyqueuosine(34) reductase QueG [Burkholderiales bacterium]